MGGEMDLKKYHDLMNSAAVIKNMAELLFEEEADLERKDMLSTIAARAEQVAEQLSKMRNDS
jgi:hypothetical protein